MFGCCFGVSHAASYAFRVLFVFPSQPIAGPWQSICLCIQCIENPQGLMSGHYAKPQPHTHTLLKTKYNRITLNPMIFRLHFSSFVFRSHSKIATNIQQRAFKEVVLQIPKSKQTHIDETSILMEKLYGVRVKKCERMTSNRSTKRLYQNGNNDKFASMSDSQLGDRMLSLVLSHQFL